MSECIRNCQLCKNFIISTAINFDPATNSVIIDLPANSYSNNCEYCIVLAQSIPDSATLNSIVVFTIGGGVTQYPFVNRDCTPIYASQLRTRRLYKTRVNTAVNTGIFKYIGKCCLPSNATTVSQSIPVPETAEAVQSTNAIKKV